jgi:hypothetical protein
MIPVIARDVTADKVSLFNPDSAGGQRFPLNAVRVRNNTGLHLKAGPVTIFDEGVYAGDARMEDIPPGDSRLVSYAVDLAVEGERQGEGVTSTETALSLRRGVLTITRRERVSTTYTLKSKADKPRTVLVEHPFRPEYTLVQPQKAEERSANYYRFAVALAPGKSEKLTVVTERPISTTLGLINADLNSLAVYATRADVPAPIREALQEVVQRRRRVQELQGTGRRARKRGTEHFQRPGAHSQKHGEPGPGLRALQTLRCRTRPAGNAHPNAAPGGRPFAQPGRRRRPRPARLR